MRLETPSLVLQRVPPTGAVGMSSRISLLHKILERIAVSTSLAQAAGVEGGGGPFPALMAQAGPQSCPTELPTFYRTRPPRNKEELSASAGSWRARWRRYTSPCASTWPRRRSSCARCCCGTSGALLCLLLDMACCCCVLRACSCWPCFCARCCGECMPGPWAPDLGAPAWMCPPPPPTPPAPPPPPPSRSYGEQAELVAQFLCCIPLATVRPVLGWLKSTMPHPQQAGLQWHVCQVRGRLAWRRVRLLGRGVSARGGRLGTAIRRSDARPTALSGRGGRKGRAGRAAERAGWPCIA